MRRETPIAWTEQYDGVFVLSRYKEIFDVVAIRKRFRTR
jgi:hypothetical protein